MLNQSGLCKPIHLDRLGRFFFHWILHELINFLIVFDSYNCSSTVQFLSFNLQHLPQFMKLYRIVYISLLFECFWRKYKTCVCHFCRFQSQADLLIKLKIHWKTTVRLPEIWICFQTHFPFHFYCLRQIHTTFVKESGCSFPVLTVSIYLAVVPPWAKETKIMFMLCRCLKAKLWSFPHVCFGQWAAEAWGKCVGG